MYSGITGEEFHADIYLGLVYYQRLRHMVNDKFQVRTTGPVDPLTRQPVKVSSRRPGYFLCCSQLLTENTLFCRVENVPVVSDSVKWNEMLLSRTVLPSCCKIDS